MVGHERGLTMILRPVCACVWVWVWVCPFREGRGWGVADRKTLRYQFPSFHICALAGCSSGIRRRPSTHSAARIYVHTSLLGIASSHPAVPSCPPPSLTAIALCVRGQIEVKRRLHQFGVRGRILKLQVVHEAFIRARTSLSDFPNSSIDLYQPERMCMWAVTRTIFICAHNQHE